MSTLQYKNLSNHDLVKELQANIALLQKYSHQITNYSLKSQLVRAATSITKNFIYYQYDIEHRPLSAIQYLFNSYASCRETTLWLELMREFKLLIDNEVTALHDYFHTLCFRFIKLINIGIEQNNIIWNTNGAKVFYYNTESLGLFVEAKKHAIALYSLLQEHSIPFLDSMIINASTSIIAQVEEGMGHKGYSRKYLKFLDDSLRQLHSLLSCLHQVLLCTQVDDTLTVSHDTIQYYITEYEKLGRMLCALINSQNRKANELEEQLISYKKQLKLQNQII